ncbi:hypothetical protein ON010_g16651 [Phytophthora cinnamomi]|nr:hypothetical protein ON010_g16651 [Phytophthora cinnamomi]
MTFNNNAEQTVRKLVGKEIDNYKLSSEEFDNLLEGEEDEFEDEVEDRAAVAIGCDVWKLNFYECNGYNNIQNLTAFVVFENYSYDFLGHVDIVSEAISYLQKYARSMIKYIDNGICAQLLTVFFKLCRNEYAIEMIGYAITDETMYMNAFDRDTYEGDLIP